MNTYSVYITARRRYEWRTVISEAMRAANAEKDVPDDHPGGAEERSRFSKFDNVELQFVICVCLS